MGKVVLGVLGVVVVLIVAAAIVVPLVVDPNDHKDRIVNLVKKKTGRDFRIDGNIRLSAFPWLAVEVEKVQLGNPTGFDDPYFARFDSAEIRVRLLPLISRKLEAGVVSVQGLSVHLETDKEGRTNWQDLARPAEAPAAEKGPEVFPPGALVIGGLDIRDASVRWTDRSVDQTVTVDNIVLKTSAVTLVDPVDVDLKLDVNSEKTGVKATVSVATRIAVDLMGSRYRAEDMKLSADLSGSAVPGGSLRLNGTGSVGFDANANRVDIAGLRLAADGLSVKPYAGTVTLETRGTGDLGSQIWDLPSVNVIASMVGDGDDIAVELACNTQVDLKNQFILLKDLFLKVPSSKLRGMAITVEGTASSAVDLSTKTASIKDLTLYGSVTGNGIPGGPVPVSMQAHVLADLNAQTAQVKSLRLEVLDIKTSGDLSLTGLSTQPEVSGSFALAKFNPRQLLTRLGIAIPRTADPKALTSAEASGLIRITANALEASKLSVSLDASRMKGSAGIRNFNAPHVQFDVNLDNLNLDGYLPPSEGSPKTGGATIAAAPAAGAALPVETLKKLSMDGKLQVASLTAAGTQLQNLQAQVKADKGVVRLSPVKAELFGGTFAANTTLDVRDGRLKIDFDENIRGLQLDRLLKAMEVNPGKLNVTGPSSLTVTGSVQGDAAGKVFRIERLAADGSIGGKLPVRLHTDAVVDLENQQAVAERLEVGLGSLKLAATGKRNGFTAQGTTAADIRLAPFDLRALMAQLGPPPTAADPRAMTAVSLSASIQSGPESLKIDDLRIRVDETNVDGFLHITGFSKPSYAFDLRVDGVDADRYLPPPVQGKKQAAAPPGAVLVLLPMDTLQNLSVDGKLAIGKLKLTNVKMDGIQVALGAKDGVVTLAPVAMNLYEGTYRGNVTVDARGKRPRLDLDDRISGVQIGALLRDLQGKTYLDGITDAHLKLGATGVDADSLLRSLEGTVTANLADGSIYGVDLAGKICRALQAYGTTSGKTEDIIGGLLQVITQQASKTEKSTGSTAFSALTGSLVFVDGIGTNEDLVMKSPLLRVDGRGRLNLPTRQLDYQTNVFLVKSCEGQGGKQFSELQNYPIPVRVSGPLDALDVKLDYTAGLSELLRRQEQKKTTEPGPAPAPRETTALPTPDSKETRPQEPAQKPKDPLKGILEQGLKELLKKQ